MDLLTFLATDDEEGQVSFRNDRLREFFDMTTKKFK